MIRLFVAVEIPEAQRRAVSAVVNRLPVPAARWVAEAGWHVTLSFLGATAEEQLPDVLSVARAVAAGSGPAQVRLAGLGAFPNPRRARVVWVGLEGAEPLGAVAAALADGYAGLGFPKEERPWRPHLTLARLKVPGPVDLGPGAGFATEAFDVSELVVFRSHLRPTGAVYEALERCPFSGPSLGPSVGRDVGRGL